MGCGSANQTPVSVCARKEEYAAIPASSAKLPHYVRCPRQIPRTQVLPVALTLPSLIHSQNPLLLRVSFSTLPPRLPFLRHCHRFTDLVFVGYTADGYKKGLCHETPTAEELAGAMQLGVGITSVVVRQLVLRDL